MLPGIRESLIEPEPQSKTSGLSYTPLPETLSWVSTQPSKKKKEKKKQNRKEHGADLFGLCSKSLFPALSLYPLANTGVCLSDIQKKKTEGGGAHFRGTIRAR